MNQLKHELPCYHTSSATILIIDDNPRNIQLLGYLLKEKGYQIAAAINAEQAYAMIESLKPDLILLDVVIPETDGFKICRKIRSFTATEHTPIVFLTAKGNTSDVISGLELGAIDYITRPFNNQELLARIKIHIRQKQKYDHMMIHMVELQERIQQEEQLLKKRQDEIQVLTIKNHDLSQKVITDELTGLYNRRYIFNRLISEIAKSQRHQADLSIIMLDIDHFKKINDRYGHPSGDIVLQDLSKIFGNAIREIDLAGRYGGEEFIIILPETDIPGAHRVAKRIQKQVAAYRNESENLSVTISQGISSLSSQCHDYTRMIALADQALYSAKKNGRNRIELAHMKPGLSTLS